MKKILPFLLLVLTLASCSQDIQFNDQAVFQGMKDNVFWKGGNAKAVLDANGRLTISAATINETMTLSIPEPTTTINPKNKNTYVTYALGTNAVNKAVYVLKSGGVEYDYETGTAIGDGEVVISQYDGLTISGSFRFNAKNTDPGSEAAELVNLQHGVLYKIPITEQAQ